MAKKKLLDLSMLIHYSTKLKNYISNKINDINLKVAEVENNIKNNKEEIEIKVNENKNLIEINKDNIVGLDGKYNKLESDIGNIRPECNGHVEGDIINTNNIEQYTFRNVKAGDVIEIPNTTGNTDFIIECFADVAEGNTIDHKVILLDSNHRENFTCDERYVEVTPDGLKPRDEIILNYTGEVVEVGEDVFEIFTSDIISEDMIDRILEIESVEEV